MCCERLQNGSRDRAQSYPVGHPARKILTEITIKIITRCPEQTHTASLAGIPKKPESDVIPAYFRNNPEDTDILEEQGVLKALLRTPGS